MNPLTVEVIQSMAADIGLARLSEAHLRQLLQVTNDKRAHQAALPFVDLTAADEPANVPNLFNIDAGEPS